MTLELVIPGERASSGPLVERVDRVLPATVLAALTVCVFVFLGPRPES